MLLSELLDHMAALERESISLRTDVECLKEIVVASEVAVLISWRAKCSS